MADLYERGRPEYPPEAIAVLGPAPGEVVLDLAAGTGKLTGALVDAGAAVIAVEPLPELRERISGALRVVDGTAEATGLEPHSVDHAAVGDAWHWFDHAAAAEELARVVRPGGRVALLSQDPRPEDSPDWLQAAWSALRRVRGDHPAFTDPGATRAPLERHPAFDGLAPHAVPFTWITDRDTFLALGASMSPVALLEEGRRADLLDEVGGYLPEGPFEVPYSTGVWTTLRS